MISLFNVDCRIAMDFFIAPESVDAVVTDPPYGIGFMGKGWDCGVPGTEFWKGALDVLKPGGYLLAFGGARTYHRMVCAIEDAGFEIRDQIMWIYGSGFPKSHNGKWGGTALKPAHEPICVARKPLIGTVEQNWTLYGTGALNIDDCRVATDDVLLTGSGGMPRHLSDEQRTGGVPRGQHDLGRWPANVIHDGGDEVLAAFPDAPGQMADASLNAEACKTQNVYGARRRGRGDEPSADSENEGAVGFKMKPGARRLDTGSAARFFYCPKASRKDRNEGCEHMTKKPLHWSSGDQNPGSFQSEGTDKSAHNNHPTVKPTELMAYLCRLVTPRGGIVLDPFMGSGSTGKAAVREGFRFIGMETDEHYFAIAQARIAAESEKA